MKVKPVIACILFLLIFYQLNSQDTISSFEGLKNYLVENSLSLKSGDLKLTQAKKEKLSAIYGLIEPTGSISGSYTNNTRLPVNLIPSEILGGQPGTFQEIRFGVQYVTNLNAYAEVKLLNLQGWENLQLSKINIQVNESDTRVKLKSLLENAAVVYFNILNLQEQLKALHQNLLSADTLYNYTQNRFVNGLANTQELNDSRVNRLNVEEAIRQLQYQITQQHIALKLLCDLPENSSLIVKPNLFYTPDLKPEVVVNSLISDNAVERSRFAKSNYKIAKYSFAPSLSLFGAYQEQQFNIKAMPFDSNTAWSESNYVGIKLVIPLPSAHMFRQTSRAKYDYLIAETNATQLKMQAELNSKTLEIEYEKAKSQVNSSIEIFNLRRETYLKNLVNYHEGILGIEPTINSFNAMINSQFSYLSSIVNLLLAGEKININNKIK